MKKINFKLPTRKHLLGGGTLTRKNSERLEKFSKNKRQKKFIIGSIIGLLLVIGGITLYKTYAFYKEEKVFNVLQGRIPNFSKQDIMLSFMIDGEKGTGTFPKKEDNLKGTQVVCENGTTANWDNKNWGLLNINAGTNSNVKCTIYFESRMLESGTNAVEYILSLEEFDDKLVKVEHEDTVQTGSNTNIDYRFIGSNPNNYVYFGCEEGSCTEDNLYRIIGVFPTQTTIDGEYKERLKLIKANFYFEERSGYLSSDNNSIYYTPNRKGYHWSKNQNKNNWEEASLNTEVLNKVYWNALGEYQKFIDSSVWYLGAPSYREENNYFSEDLYGLERSDTYSFSGGSLSFEANIGLMYASDYAYSIDLEYWDNKVYNNRDNYKTNAWLNILEGKYHEWTITPESVYSGSNGIRAWYATKYGELSGFGAVSSSISCIRPTFYLKSEVTLKDGNGTMDSPYILSI